MCGIVGIIATHPESQVDPKSIRKMADAIRHRGPDDEGYFVRRDVAFGNRRLSIIDLEAGKQPMSTPDKRYTIVYNGEIFNYRALKDELIREGSVFQTESDTEVVLAGFAKHGPPFLDRLDGMFAAFIYDARTEIVHAIRDAFGIKPLYGFQDSNFLYLASEIRAIRAVTNEVRTLDEEKLRSYLSCGYVPGRETLFKGVFRISPGSIFSASLAEQGKAPAEFTFSQRLTPQVLAHATSDGPSLHSVLISAVEKSLVADVPIGLYLSGGIDSSLIASIVSRELGKKLNSFSVRFPGDGSYDEGPFAEKVAKELGLKHESIAVGPEDFLDLRKLARTLEEPMADPSAAALGRLSAFTSKHLKVVLSGEGGDELFGGYHRYFWDALISKYLELPWLLRAPAEQFGKIFGGKKIQRRIEKLHETMNLSRPIRYLSWFGPFRRPELEQLLAAGPSASPKVENLFQRVFEVASPLPETAQGQWVDIVTFLRDDLLIKADKMSMANSLEVRVPFLQAPVVQAAFSLAERDRVRMGQTKPFLREMLRKYLPPEIVDRKKQGFEVPLGRWFRGPLQPLLDQFVSESAVKNRGLLKWETVQSIRNEHASEKSDRGLALFTLAIFEAWCQEHVDA